MESPIRGRAEGRAGPGTTTPGVPGAGAAILGVAWRRGRPGRDDGRENEAAGRQAGRRRPLPPVPRGFCQGGEIVIEGLNISFGKRQDRGRKEATARLSSSRAFTQVLGYRLAAAS